MSQHRFSDAELHALPCERYAPVARHVAAGDEAEDETEHHGPAEERPLGECLAHLEIGDLSGDSTPPIARYTTSRLPVNHAVAIHAGEVKGQAKQVDVGEELAGRRRDREAPPALGQHGGGPAPRESIRASTPAASRARRMPLDMRG
jgi:hypothetical protein